MKKYLSFFIVNIFLLILFCSPVIAAEFKLTAIGALDVSQNLYSHMWYTGNQPTFRGTGTSGSAVDITVDGNSYSTTVDTNEQWSWTPPEALSSADHSLTFTSGADTISLTLTTGSDVPDDIKSPDATGEVPVPGLFAPTFLLFTGGSLLATLPFWKKFAFSN